MKILYVITSTDLGGAEKFLTELVKVSAKKHTVEVVSLNKEGCLTEQLYANGARKVLSCNMTKSYKMGIVRELARIIDSFKPDIVHAFLYRAIQFCRLACAKKKCKLISSPHFDMAKRNFLLRGLDRFLSPVDFLCVAESFSTARYLTEKQKYRKDKVYFLPNGVDKTKFFPADAVRDAMRKKYNFSADNIVFISVARLAPVKDPMTLLKAFCKVYRGNKNVRLVWVGNGEKRQEANAFIASNNLQKSVLLVGQQDNINDFLNMADVFVLPSIEESLPLSLLEAISAGLPCIVSNVGDMKMWVSHGKNGFVFKKKDEVLLSCLMAELAENDELRDKMKQASIQKSQEIIDPFGRYQQIYEQIENKKFSCENF